MNKRNKKKQQKGGNRRQHPSAPVPVCGCVWVGGCRGEGETEEKTSPASSKTKKREREIAIHGDPTYDHTKKEERRPVRCVDSVSPHPLFSPSPFL